MNESGLGIGVVGFGSFAIFAVQQFVQVPGVSLVEVAETSNEAARAVAARFGLGAPGTLEQLLANPAVELVYIATPPFLHFAQVRAALEAGKHVICEKPLALTGAEARQLADLAQARDLCLVANLMQRYNPLYSRVQEVITKQLLGKPLYARLENFASDENLRPNHWFWDREKSGGIFLEHGVHFFDMFEGWFGQGEVISARRQLRSGSGVEEQVSCTGIFGDVEVHHLHSFTQASRMDRQEFRIGFELGEIRLHEWVPTRADVYGIVSDESCRELMRLFPDSRLNISTRYAEKDQQTTCRFTDHVVTQDAEIHFGAGVVKYHVYGDLLRAMMGDQMTWINDRAHHRHITTENAVRSVRLAEQATNLANAAP